ncbi:MAG: hypothetical protein LZF60_140048 [Nitrospira sp.]|nr:MAG: hypothetical protein LZF60_140048 [Nitrospira sp.]
MFKMRPKPKETYLARLKRQYPSHEGLAEAVAAYQGHTHLLEMDADEAEEAIRWAELERFGADRRAEAGQVKDGRLLGSVPDQTKTLPKWKRWQKSSVNARKRVYKRADADIDDLINQDIGGKPRRMGMVRGQGNGHTFRPLNPRYWTRKELYNRVRWLRGEITRLIMNEDPNKKRDLSFRQSQLRTYQKIRMERDAELSEMARQKHNDKRRAKRAREKLKAQKAKEKTWIEKKKAERLARRTEREATIATRKKTSKKD